MDRERLGRSRRVNGKDQNGELIRENGGKSENE
jgi:hypothetical protein